VGAIPSFQAVGTPNTALNVAGGSQGHILVQTALDTTEFVAAGAAQTVLISNGVGLTPGFAEYKPVNIAGGLIGYLPVQSAVNTTTFIAPGSSGQVLTSNGPGVLPFYSTPIFNTTGTFIPTLVSDLSGPSPSYVAQFGRWIKVGRSVMMNIFIQTNNSLQGVTLSTYYVTNLPDYTTMGATPYQNTYNRPTGTVFFKNWTSYSSYNTIETVPMFSDNGPVAIRFYRQGSNLLQAEFVEDQFKDRTLEITMSWITTS
jgi:hypothetical protein